MDFTHLHVHSHYSLMDGLCSPKELLTAAKNAGQTAMAITDHGTLASHRDLQIAAKEMGMKPILGLEAYISATDRFDKRDIKSRDDNTQIFNHIILLTKNNQGLKNLQKLSEIAWTEGYYRKPRIDLEVLDEYGDGLIVLSGCMNGLIAKAIQNNNMDKALEYARWFKNRFKDDFYLEVQSHNDKEVNDGLKKISKDLNIPRADVVKHINEWRSIIQNDTSIQMRAKEALAGADQQARCIGLARDDQCVAVFRCVHVELSKRWSGLSRRRPPRQSPAGRRRRAASTPRRPWSARPSP